jgi:TolB-like protein
LHLFKELQRRNVVRVTIGYVISCWLLAQVADLVLENIGAPAWVMQAILLVFALGFPVVVFFSWAYEVTPEGIKRESEVDRTQSITHITGNKLDRAIVAVLVVALAYFVYDKFIVSAEREAAFVEAATQAVTEQAAAEQEVAAETDKSIAVLPFVNMSNDANNEYFSDGLSEELLNLLAKIPELRVAARTSSFALRGKELQISEVGEILKVAHILEGSVRKAGDQVRITAQLVNTDDGYHLWSETYDRKLDNIFAIQEEIAAAVVEQLKIKLLGDAPKVQKTNPEALALYLQARHLGRLFTAENFEQSNALLKRALAIDPEYAAAWGGLASNYTNQAQNGLRPSEEGHRLAREAIEKALSINPDYAPAYALLGRMARSSDLSTAARHYQHALELNPTNIDMIREAATMLHHLGRQDEALALGEYVAERDPVNSLVHNNLGLGYLWAGYPDQAIAAFQTVLRLSPNRIGGHYGIGASLLIKGEAQAALEEFRLEKDEEYRTKGMALAFYALGRQEESASALAELIERWGEEWPSEVAHVYAWMGDADAAFLWLDKAIEQSEGGIEEQFMWPFYAPIHDEPRWAEFRERVGSSPAQLDAIKFEVKLPD